MKRISLILIFLFFAVICNAQTIDKLSKKELKNALVRNIAITDSLKSCIVKQNADIQELKNTLASYKIQKEDISKALDRKESELKLKNEELRTKEQQNKSSQSKISSLETENLKLKNDLSKLQKDLIVVQEKIQLYSDSLNQSVVDSQTVAKAGDDFLNEYFKNPYPLDNLSLKLTLEKIILGNASSGDGNYEFEIFSNSGWYNRQETKVNYFLPEVIDKKDLTFYIFNSSQNFYKENVLRTILYKSSVAEFSDYLPRIEILKNIVLTLSYTNGSSENFLFNVEEGLLNNSRKTLQLNLASEEMNSDDSNDDRNLENDIIWKVFVIEGECYLALTSQHLNRIGATIGSDEFGGIGNNSIRDKSNFSLDASSVFLVARNKDQHMAQLYINDSEDMIFLFKLEEVEK